jgi:hypothetical protein
MKKLLSVSSEYPGGSDFPPGLFFPPDVFPAPFIPVLFVPAQPAGTDQVPLAQLAGVFEKPGTEIRRVNLFNNSQAPGDVAAALENDVGSCVAVQYYSLLEKFFANKEET